MKYGDTPLFLEIDNITSQYRFLANARANAAFPNSGFNLFEFGSSAEIAENPIISYSPLQGQKFIRQFLAKIPLESIYLLYKSGWSIERILRLCFEQMGPLDNAPNASGPTPKQAPIFEEFLLASRLFRELQNKNLLKIFLEKDKGQPTLVLKLLPKAKSGLQTKMLNKLFNTPPQNLNFYFGFNENNSENSKLHIETRSLLGIMYYLSNTVEPTKEALKNGYVTQTFDAYKQPFSWDDVTENLLKVHSNSTKPDKASVKVFYERDVHRVWQRAL